MLVGPVQKVGKNVQELLICVRINTLSTAVVHNTAQNSSDNFPSYPPQSHHSSDDVYWRAGKEFTRPNLPSAIY